ncbi:MAG: DUF898 family protein [Lewinellaceae bacterium]|nr:DUF898 family protein [Phaeodactylibacter sp.]MCB0614823.1 DUF898 family protein [Phaeodactylibacter sp.]MCB9352673.1 DUF898 family protein [Lewinellaceae bacterium]
MKNFQFDGKARQYFFVGIAAFLITGITFGIALPWAVTLVQQWKASHTLVEGRRLKFYGSGGELFGKYIVWWILTIITLGIYSIAVYPRFTKWTIERTDFA